jgi:signal peptidase I
MEAQQRDFNFHAPSAGRSMWPMIRNGDVLVVKSLDPADLRLGDIVAFKRCGRLFAHRVVGVSQQGDGKVVLTRGDACGTPDLPLPQSAILGRVESIVRGKRVINLSARFHTVAAGIIARCSRKTQVAYYAVRVLARTLGPEKMRLQRVTRSPQ